MVWCVMGEAEGIDQELVCKVRDQAIVPLKKDPEVPKLQRMLLRANVH